MNQKAAADFDSLAKKSFAPDATSDDYEKMFAAVFRFTNGILLPFSEMPNISPYCAIFPGILGDKPAVAVFTDIERARKFIRQTT